MQITNSSGIYSMLLDEHEWYSVDDASREALCLKAMLGAQEAECRYVSIFVEPDPLFSRLVSKTRVRVYTHTFPTPIGQEFADKFAALLDSYVGPGKLTQQQAARLALKVLG